MCYKVASPIYTKLNWLEPLIKPIKTWLWNLKRSKKKASFSSTIMQYRHHSFNTIQFSHSLYIYIFIYELFNNSSKEKYFWKWNKNAKYLIDICDYKKVYGCWLNVCCNVFTKSSADSRFINLNKTRWYIIQTTRF